MLSLNAVHLVQFISVDCLRHMFTLYIVVFLEQLGCLSHPVSKRLFSFFITEMQRLEFPNCSADNYIRCLSVNIRHCGAISPVFGVSLQHFRAAEKIRLTNRHSIEGLSSNSRLLKSYRRCGVWTNNSRLCSS